MNNIILTLTTSILLFRKEKKRNDINIVYKLK